jgi:hypothetical protein
MFPEGETKLVAPDAGDAAASRIRSERVSPRAIMS